MLLFSILCIQHSLCLLQYALPTAPASTHVDTSLDEAVIPLTQVQTIELAQVAALLLGTVRSAYLTRPSPSSLLSPLIYLIFLAALLLGTVRSAYLSRPLSHYSCSLFL